MLANWSEQDELIPVSSAFTSNDRLGQSVAIDGDTAVVGAPNDESGRGSVYIFKRTGTTWNETQRLVAPDRAAGDNFGFSVGISGNVIVVGAPFDNLGVGSVYMFERADASSNFTNPNLGPHFTGTSLIGDSSISFGQSVAIDGNAVVVGAPLDDNTALDNAGSVQLFVRNGVNSWSAGPKFRPIGIQPADEFGRSVGISGNRIVVGAPGVDASPSIQAVGAAYALTRSGTVISSVTQEKLMASDFAASDQFGSSVAVDGSTLVVGSPFANQVSPAVADVGAAYVFVEGGSGWTEQAKLTRPTPDANENLGVAVAIEGDLAVVGIPLFNATPGDQSGGVGVFRRNGSSWSLEDVAVIETELAARGGSRLGGAVSIDGGAILAGARNHAHTGIGTQSGAAYVFVDPNDAPSFTPGANPIVSEDSGAQSVTNWATNISAGPPDESGQTLQFLVTNNTNPSLFAVPPAISPTGTLTFTPAANANGAATITVELKDNGGIANGGDDTSDPAVFTIAVNPVNDAPTVANAIANVTVNEDAADTVLDLSATFADVDIATNGDSLTLSVSDNTNAGLVSTAIAGNSLTLTYAANQNGTATITVRATDDDGAYAETSFLVTVDSVNDAPTVANAIANVTVNEDAADTVLDLSATFADADIATNGDSLTLSVTGNTPGGLVSTAIVGNALTLSYAANQNGTATITVRATDDDGAFVETSFPVTVNPVNDAPAAIAQNVSVEEDGQVPINLGGADIESPTGNLTFTILSLPATGVLTVGGVPVQINQTFSGPPTLVYEPSIGASATSASFDFTVTDDGDDSAPGQGDQTSAAATVTIDIIPAVAPGTATLVDGILRAAGGSGNDSVLVSRSGSTWNVSINGVTTTFALATVTEVRLWGRDGNDTIVVDTNISVPATIDAGAGNDVVTGGNGHDLIFGGSGVDLLFGNGGNDMVIGGDGFDLVSGGAGHDVVVAGSVAATFTAAMLRDVAAAWAANRTATEGADDGTVDESALDDDFDIVSGGSGADWFIVNVGDWIIDYRPNGVNGDLITQI